MLLKYFYDDSLAHASYLVGCQRDKIALVVDPGRDVEQYLQFAAKEDLKIVAVAETHIHADYVSGARELAARVGAKLYVSDEGPAEWKYEYVQDYEHQLLHDGDQFPLGNLRFEVMHTPGHTPESISFLLTDQGGGADRPMGIFTGDFVFVGSIGRPDLLEEAAGLENTAEPGARDLFRSVERFRKLPDYLQIWPAHGAGSACGKGLGAVPSSTVGYEKLFNPALQYDDEEAFVKYILADQPAAPKYFALMKRVNKLGPKLLPAKENIRQLDMSDMATIQAAGNSNIVDLRPADAFSKAHLPHSLNLPMSMLAEWAGWLLDYDQPTYLLAETDQLAEATRLLHKIGVDEVAGFLDNSTLGSNPQASQSYPNATPEELLESIRGEDVQVVDVRTQPEWQAGHLQHATHHFLGKLPQTMVNLSKQKPVVVHCRSGGRSAIAASLLQANGFEVINMTGGYLAWLQADLPVETEPAAAPLSA